MIDIQKYLDGGSNKYLDYSDFTENHVVDDDKVFVKIHEFIRNHVKDILLIRIEEDKIFLTKNELKKLPTGVSRYLRYSERKGIKIYVFNTKDGGFMKAVGIFGGTMGRANEYYFDQIIHDKQYEKITKTVSVKLTELLSR